jgi:hypothetical protein
MGPYSGSGQFRPPATTIPRPGYGTGYGPGAGYGPWGGGPRGGWGYGRGYDDRWGGGYGYGRPGYGYPVQPVAPTTEAGAKEGAPSEAGAAVEPPSEPAEENTGG